MTPSNPFKDKMKGSMDAPQVFAEMPKKDSNALQVNDEKHTVGSTQINAPTSDDAPSSSNSVPKIDVQVPKDATHNPDSSQVESDAGWTDVKRKKLVNLSDCEASPSPPANFKNLKAVDEIAAKQSTSTFGPVNCAKVSPKRLTKSQKRKLKSSSGVSSPSLS
ncbi:hypothetical protein ACET3Z_028192 [Daucus carota]